MKNSSRRFTSEKTANSFASKVNGTVSDLRGHSERKSDFKVKYEVNGDRGHDSEDYDPNPFPGYDYAHTSDDL